MFLGEHELTYYDWVLVFRTGKLQCNYNQTKTLAIK